jgi:hypothetical protein
MSPAQGSSGGSTRLLVQISSGGTTCHRLRASPGPARVSWAPAPTSRRRTAPGVPRVPIAPGRRKNVGSSRSETELRTIFFSTRRPTQGSSEGSACPRGSGPNEDRRADAEDLTEPGQCKPTPIRSKWNRVQGAAADSYRIDPDPICGGSAVADQKAAAARLRDSDGGGRVAPRHGDEEETSVEARTSDDEDQRQNRSDQRRSEG